MGRDFGDVKIHTDGKAAGLSQSINAKAFTYGNNVAFNHGEYRPGTTEGRRLIAHELTHVVQQGKAGVSRQVMRYVAPPDWLDYAGLVVDAVELAYIDLALPEGDYKNFRRLLNYLFWAIDLILAATPGAGGGGGGVALRVAGQGGGAILWRTLPNGMRMQAVKLAAEQVGMPVARATQMINAYFAVAEQSAPVVFRLR